MKNRDKKTSRFMLCVLFSTAFIPGFASQAVMAQETAPLLNACSSYVDRTEVDADRTLNWTYGIEEDPERCIKIKVGQTVTFEGNLNTHPIEAQGGNTPNPFAGALSSTQTFTFEQAGGFGFVCIFHDEMQGVIWVVS